MRLLLQCPVITITITTWYLAHSWCSVKSVEWTLIWIQKALHCTDACLELNWQRSWVHVTSENCSGTMGTCQRRQIQRGLLSHRYEEEINKRTAVENDFVLLKKVKDLSPSLPAQSSKSRVVWRLRGSTSLVLLSERSSLGHVGEGLG